MADRSTYILTRNQDATDKEDNGAVDVIWRKELSIEKAARLTQEEERQKELEEQK